MNIRHKWTLAIVTLFVAVNCNGGPLAPTAGAGLADSSLVETATSIPTLTPSPTATATSTPVPEISTVVLPIGSGSLYFTNDEWFYDSPELVQAGKAVPIEFRTIEYSDSGVHYWLTPRDRPDWPLFIRNNETGEWTQVMRYIDVVRRLSFSVRHRQSAESMALPLDIAVPLNFADLVLRTSSQLRWRSYYLSAIVVSAPFVEDNMLLMTVATPFSDNPEDPMLLFNVALGENDASAASKRVLEYMDVSGDDGWKRFQLLMLEDGPSFDTSKVFMEGRQIIINGVEWSSGEALRSFRENDLSGWRNWQDAFDHYNETRAILSAIEENQFLQIDPFTPLKLWGAISFFVRSN